MSCSCSVSACESLWLLFALIDEMSKGQLQNHQTVITEMGPVDPQSKLWLPSLLRNRGLVASKSEIIGFLLTFEESLLPRYDVFTRFSGKDSKMVCEQGLLSPFLSNICLLFSQMECPGSAEICLQVRQGKITADYKVSDFIYNPSSLTLLPSPSFCCLVCIILTPSASILFTF